MTTTWNTRFSAVFVLSFFLPVAALAQSATYLGGADTEIDASMVIHPVNGDIYVTGATSSDDFPGTASGALPAFGGYNDAFVARISADLTTLVQATYFGSSSGDAGNTATGEAIAISPADGSVYIVGHTGANSIPGLEGGAQEGFGGQSDAYVARFSADLSTLLQATYFGADNRELGLAIAINTVEGHAQYGSVYITGTVDWAGDIPGVEGGAQSIASGSATVGFVARLSADLSTLEQSTYLGGTDSDTPHDLMVHPTSGAVCVTGNTYSDDFAATAGGAQETHGGIRDAFVSCFSPELTAFVQSTYFGGTGVGWGSSITADPATGDVYVAGQTYSDDLPGTAGGAQPDKNDPGSTSHDAFVVRFSEDLTTLRQATYLGSSGDEYNMTIAIHPDSGQVFVSGETYEGDFPGTEGGMDPSFAGDPDEFVARFSADLTTLHQSTYYGGWDTDSNGDIAIDPESGDIFVTGYTFCLDLQGVEGSAQAVHGGGGRDIYVARIDESLQAEVAEGDIQVSPASHDFGEVEVGQGSTPVEIVLTNGGDAAVHVADYSLVDSTHFTVDANAGDSPCGDAPVEIAVGAACSLFVTFEPAAVGAQSTTLTIASDDPDTPSATVDLSGTGTDEPVVEAPSISVTPAHLDFGQIDVESSSEPQVITIANTGDATLLVTAMTLSDATRFSYDVAAGSNPCGSEDPTIAAGADCTLSVTFQPTEAGDVAATLSISSNDADEPAVEVTLSAAGTEDGGDKAGCSCGPETTPANLLGMTLLLFVALWRRRKSWR